ncbi:MAG: hypothetical protein WKG07_05300 [Hymenobacter sp.]
MGRLAGLSLCSAAGPGPGAVPESRRLHARRGQQRAGRRLRHGHYERDAGQLSTTPAGTTRRAIRTSAARRPARGAPA